MKKTIVDRLQILYPNSVCELNFSSPFELLVAVILSAQCTDKRVNIVTSSLFKEMNTPIEFASCPQEVLETKIHSCGFFKNKAKNIIAASKDIATKFNGEVPNNYEDLLSLAGVGKKTASVVLSLAYKIPAVAVDTHVFRLSKRLGLADEKSPEKTQEVLEKIIPKKYWINSHYAMVLHGRYVCKAIKPLCDECKMNDICPFYSKKANNGK